MSKVRRKSDNHIPYSTAKELYNPFPDLTRDVLYERQAAKSPKVSKRAWKCFQLVLICQKLLKPFSSSNKSPECDQTDHKMKILRGQSHENRRPRQGITSISSVMVDTGVQTNADDPVPDHNRSNEDLTSYDIDDPEIKEPYWDLDIDSAIVGDFNSMSALSLDEQIDPHYATIKLSPDGRVVGKSLCVGDQIFCTTSHPSEDIGSSNNSSPKSGIYSKIVKPKNSAYIDPRQINELYRLQSCGRLNFDQIMAIRSQLGLVQRDVSYCYKKTSATCSVSDTPDVPRRNYGSSVVNFITKLRQSEQYQSSGINSSSLNLEKDQSPGGVYSPIWTTERRHYGRVSKFSDTPSSEPIAPKRALNKILHQLNPTYRDDSSEEASSISFTSPFKVQYSYPRNFSDNYSRKSSFGSVKNSYVNLLTEEINRFRHMDSEVDVSVPYSIVKDTVTYHGSINDPIAKFPSQTMTAMGSEDFHLICDEKIFLQPLMERSCEEDYFNRDILSSLDYINV